MSQLLAIASSRRWKANCYVLVVILLSSLHGVAQIATVSGTVTVLGSPLPIRGALVAVDDSEAKVAKARIQTDLNGRYSIDLPAPGHYEMLAVDSGHCPVKRPTFDIVPGERLVFDFGLQLCRTGDPPPSHPNFPYKEEVISSADKQKVIIGYRSQNQNDGLTEFHNLKAYGPSRLKLPVTVRFRNYTIQGDSVTLDKRKMVLRIIGSVSMSDASLKEPYRGPCVAVSLTEPRPQPSPCGH